MDGRAAAWSPEEGRQALTAGVDGGNRRWRNSGETLVIYVASRINQLRKSSSPASHARKANRISILRNICVIALPK